MKISQIEWDEEENKTAHTTWGKNVIHSWCVSNNWFLGAEIESACTIVHVTLFVYLLLFLRLIYLFFLYFLLVKEFCSNLHKHRILYVRFDVFFLYFPFAPPAFHHLCSSYACAVQHVLMQIVLSTRSFMAVSVWHRNKLDTICYSIFILLTLRTVLLQLRCRCYACMFLRTRYSIYFQMICRFFLFCCTLSPCVCLCWPVCSQFSLIL